MIYYSVSYSQTGLKNIQSKLQTLIETDFFDTAVVAIDVYDLTEQRTIFKKNEKLLLHPASNMKILTTAAALYFLGKDYTFETSFYYSGELIDSTCYGDLYVVGGGDPDFTSAELDSIVRQIKEFGIKKITGNLYGDVSYLDSLYWGSGWMWDDDPYSDFPYMSAININDACVKFYYEPDEIGNSVNVESVPQSNFYTFENFSITSETDSSTFEITRNWLENKNEFLAVGELGISEKPDSLLLNVVEPEKYFLTLMKESLQKSGIKFRGTTDTASLTENAVKIISYTRSFTSVINNLNKDSDNLSAEMTLRALAFKFFGDPASAENGIKMIDSLIVLMGFDADNYRIVDGSGVSHYNLVSAELINGLLKYFYNDQKENFEILYNSFPIAGIDGSLEKRMITLPALNNVRAKTGTLSGVSCLSGYLNADNGSLYSFSILIQNYVGSEKRAQRYLDLISNVLCGDN